MANSVPGQVSAGPIDGLFRDDPGDGTLGLPDYSLVPYAYAPLLGPADSSPQWALDQWRSNAFAAFKGHPDGFGALRSVGGPRGAASIEVLPMASGTASTSPDGSRAPDYTWGPGDFAFAVRHPGTSTWTPSGTRAYVVFSQSDNTVGMRLTTASALGPWDAELADSNAVSLDGLIDVWNGGAHTFALATFGQNVVVLIDEILAIPFRAPRAYKRNADGTTDSAVFSNLPTTGDYVGYDSRGAENFLYGWTALQQPSGDLFSYDMGALNVQTPPATPYTPTTTPSGETWALTGTVTASKDGVLLAANATASFNVDWPYGVLSTRWGTAAAEGGLVLRKVDANNYYQVTSTGVYRVVGGTMTKFHTFTTPLVSGDHVVVRNWPDRLRVWVNGVSAAYYIVSSHAEGRGVGFLSPAAGTSQWRYIAFQPLVSSIALPTT